MTREEETGWKVLTLANESLEMLGGVMNVVGNTLQSAEEWAGRLGKKRAGATETPPTESMRDEKHDKGQEMQIDG
jgi:hypothetical protein